LESVTKALRHLPQWHWRETIAAEATYRLGLELREIGEHAVQVCTGLDFDQSLKDWAWTEIMQMLSGTLSARARYKGGRGLAVGWIDAEKMTSYDGMSCRVEIGAVTAVRTYQ